MAQRSFARDWHVDRSACLGRPTRVERIEAFLRDLRGFVMK
jgi:hypothetical protein